MDEFSFTACFSWVLARASLRLEPFQRFSLRRETVKTVDVWPSPVVTQLKQGVNESLTFDLMAMSR